MAKNLTEWQLRLEKVVETMKALADPYRLHILDLLTQGEACHSELKEQVGLPPTCSLIICGCCVRPDWFVPIHLGFPHLAVATGSEEEVRPTFRRVRDAITEQVTNYLHQ